MVDTCCGAAKQMTQLAAAERATRAWKQHGRPRKLVKIRLRRTDLK